LDLEPTDIKISHMQKSIIHDAIIEKNIDRYVKRQRRIKSLKTPILKMRNVLQGIVGENIEVLHEEEFIDTSSQDEVHEFSKSILENLNFPDSIDYFHDVLRKNLINTNKKWAKRTNNPI
jgi:hypothetical protein